LFFGFVKKRLSVNAEQIKDLSECTHEFEDKLLKEVKRLENFASAADEMQMKSIAEFKKAYEVIIWYC
jgi:kinesin family protein 11